MLKLLADENFDGDIVNGLRLRAPKMDLITVQEAELSGMKDPPLLEWAAQQNHILITHDVATVPDFAYERVNKGLPMPGVWLVLTSIPVGLAIEMLLIYWEESQQNEWEGKVEHVKL